MGEIRSGIWRKFRFRNMTISQAFMFLTVLTLLAATIRKNEIKRVSDPFYTGKNGKQGNKDNHFGLGLHICRILCEKHGGLLIIKNDISGGGLVTAKFSKNINDSVSL
ncbi:hypothetical protein GH810_11095 [Acetobacterium paludosum]|uniref:Histidine kinase/HSP90-like ATPase domain-containing protein n=1 Tax=Acetobacterium paludosum TaxID=52693 RepID=A0A923KQ72_9FIRM|nr:hypothetical protein [Acetobacterium paludosum]MBC3888859.1 hypothetical protein [Acetobacterium paludosum]